MRRAIAFACFFLSGAAGLIYEVCWIREASLVFGSTIHAVSTVLGVFFLGLAIGSELFGRVSQRTSRPLRIYAWVEVALAAVAAATLALFGVADSLFEHVYRASEAAPVLRGAARFALVAAVILPPTILMGGTLPLFCRQFVVRRSRIAGSVGFLYGLNTLGAAVGCAVAGLHLIPTLGVQGSVLLAAGVNVAAGLIVGVMGWRREPGPRGADAAGGESAAGVTGSRRRPRRAGAPAPRPAAPARLALVLPALVFLVGFVALGYEVLWTRYLALVVRNTVYTYTLTLTVVLAGIVLGSFLAARLFDRPGPRVAVFGSFQVLVGLVVLGAMMLPPPLWRAIGDDMRIYFLLLLPAAVLSGASFPLAVRILVDDPERAGAGVGRMAALNTLGGIVGSLMVGFVVLPRLGLANGLALVTGMSVATGIAAWLLLGPPGSRPARIAAAAAVVVWLAIPRVAGTRIPADFLAGGAELVDYREGVQSNLAVVRKEGVLFLEIDRWWQGQDRKTHQVMAAHLPMLLHPRPRRVLVVGAGAGQTPSRIPMYEIERLDCVDIEPAVFDLIRDHFESGWMADPRVRLIREDGRNHVAHAADRYDVISIEVGQIFRPGIAAFYTEDFYRQARERLAPGGLLSQFVPISFTSPETFASLIATFVKVFPQSTLWYNTSELLLVGARAEAFELDGARLELLSADGPVREDLGFGHWGGREHWLNRPVVFLAAFLAGPRDLPALSGGAAAFTDDRPVLEYVTSDVREGQGHDAAIVERLRSHAGEVGAIVSPRLAEDSLVVIRAVRERNLGQILSHAALARLTGAEPYEAAVRILENALRANPDNAKANRLMADALAFGGRLEEAVAHYEKAVAMRPEDGLAHRGLGQALLRLDRAREAIPHYRTAIDLVGGDADTWNNLGAALERVGEIGEASGHYERALRLRPGFVGARLNLERVRELLRARAAP